MKTLETEAKRRGVKISETFGLEAYAPDGLVFNASGCHCLVVSGVTRTTKELRADMLEQLSQGLSVCDDKECETCQDIGLSIETRYMAMVYKCPCNCRDCVAYGVCTGGQDPYPSGYRVLQAIQAQIYGDSDASVPCSNCCHNPCTC